MFPDRLKPTDNLVSWNTIPEGEISLRLNALAENNQQPILLIAKDMHHAEELFDALQFFSKNAQQIYLFPDRETLPFDHFSPHEDLTSERLRMLSLLPHLKKGIVVAAASTLMHRLPPKTFLDAYQFSWKLKDTLQLTDVQKQLAQAGYHHTQQVMHHGEFSVRGAIIDIFPMGSELPYRVELFDNEIESIRTFDPETQTSIEKISHINLLPAHEYPLTDEAVAYFRTQWRARFSGNPAESPVYEHISKKQPIGGIEYYLPLFFESLSSFFEYCPSNMICASIDIQENLKTFLNEVTHRFEQHNVDSTRPLCPPRDLFFSVEQYSAALKPFQQVRITPNKNFPHPILAIKDTDSIFNQLNTLEGKILICAESTGRREIIGELLEKNGIKFNLTNTWQAFLNEKNAGIYITLSTISEPLFLSDKKITLITEAQLLGYQSTPIRRTKKRQQDSNTIIRNLMELTVGMRVVHIDHGVGKYIGLEKISVDHIESEYVTLEYADNDRIYVPIHALHLINRYAGPDSDGVPLNKLGTQQWEKAKEKAAKQIRDIAADLLKVYAEREATQGFAFHTPNADFFKFKSAFPFEETPDQTSAITAVIKDMTSPKCMDRLICGDVGFGKTEVAMQAAFLAVQSGKQVVVLVPTTLLANQHQQNFQDRFSDWPIKIEVMTRLQSTKQHKETLEKLAKGTADIVIGTHALLNKKINFKNIGLLIIDEEHRFGVAQKEKIKSLRAHVDILTLTATPIPRTLNLAMSGIRDLSIIATPPLKRLSIKTFVHAYDEALIREAVIRETMRGGQIYFLHNEVTTMPLMLKKLQALLPEIKITHAHGQMPKQQLEKTMYDFYHQRFQMLIATTIIESGIDIPSANTIIINNANAFGLAQLHQIRGRVGRSHHQAYAYLLVKDIQTLTKDAEKRLEAITLLDELGAGFQLATHDLEIRGAGELLGASQSGHMHTIGFTLYMEMLEETIKALKAGELPPNTITRNAGPEIDLQISALFPEAYIPDIHTRLILYKRLSACITTHEIESIKTELIDRFGLLPIAAKNLFSLTELKLLAQSLGVKKIEMNKQYGYIYFDEKPKINPEKVIALVQKQHQLYQFSGKNTLRLKTPLGEAHHRIKVLHDLLIAIQC